VSEAIKSDVKAAAKETIDQLPEGVSWEDLMYRLYVRQKIEAGLRDVQERKVVSNVDVRKKYGLSG
jgi:hypothetical protein